LEELKMNLKKIISAVAATAVAVTTMAISSFAIKDYPDGYTLDLIADGYNVTDVYGFTFNISGNIDSGVGGGVGFNSASTGWESHEWGNDDAGKELKGSSGVLTVLKTSPVFKESDVTDPSNPYAQIWMQQWWGSDITINSVEVLGKDGVVLSSASASDTSDEAAPAEEATTEAPAAEETKTEVVTVEEEEEVVVADEDDSEPVAIDVADDVDDGDYDFDDAAAEDTSAVAETAPAATTTTTAAATGNTSAAVIFSVMAVAGVAAIAAKKRK
jgi:hypothetical protein